VKIKKVSFNISLLLLTLFNVIGSAAFSFPIESLEHNSSNSYSIKTQQNTKAIFTEEVSISVIIEIASKPDYLSSGGIDLNSFGLEESIRSSSTYKLWCYTPDLKNLLSQNIFPFQFFW
tara:strand:- start:1372 stop:1728 length:357 start_codon:yes stop_codon:yes gene_type:complete